MDSIDYTRALQSARAVLEQFLFDDESQLRDDVAQICMHIDDLLPANPLPVESEIQSVDEAA